MSSYLLITSGEKKNTSFLYVQNKKEDENIGKWKVSLMPTYFTVNFEYILSFNEIVFPIVSHNNWVPN